MILKKHLTNCFYCIIILTTISCANYKINISLSNQDWETLMPADTAQLAYRVFLLGDAGNSPMNGIDPAIVTLGKHLEEADTNSAAIVLGDNIYPYGLASTRTPSARQQSQYRLDKQLEILKPFQGRSIIVPGNHDWGYGLAAVRRQSNYVEQYMDKDYTVFVPRNGCGDPELIELSDNLVVIAFDSEWWLQTWSEEPNINDGCEVKSREMFVAYFEEMVKDHKDKNIIIALHHPLYSNGPHGGYFTVKQHLFPLTDLRNNWYFPMPGIGTLASSLRAVVGTDEDISHPVYQQMRANLVSIVQKHTDNAMFVSGHEHNLQLFNIDSINYVVSGAGSKRSPAAKGNGADFTYGNNGFSYLDIFKDGSIWIYFIVPDQANPKGKVVFRKKIKGVLPKVKKPKPRTFNEYNLHQDSVTIAVYPQEDKQLIDEAFFSGTNNELYYEPVKAPVLELDKFRGGMTPIKREGGVYTKSLRLKDPNGRLFKMRSLRKETPAALPNQFNPQLNEEVADFFYTASNPYAALAVPALCKATNIYHATPKLYYVPKQPALGKYNDDFGGQLYLVEERADEDWSDLASFGNSKKIIGTTNILEKIKNNNKTQIDQKAVLRARLLDMILGDWDRHYDQWRWAELDNGQTDIDYYAPIPRDRDMAFSQYDGFLPTLLSYTIPFFRSAQNYRIEIEGDRVKWLNYQARGFDKIFLNELIWKDWEEQTRFIQEQLTDEVIAQSLKAMPTPVYKKLKENLTEKIQARRNQLIEFARAQYESLSEIVDVVGTENKNRFVVIRKPKTVEVKVYETRKGVEQQIYRRNFSKNLTKEIRLYGLDKEDTFLIEGKVKNGIMIRCIGGDEKDKFIDKSIVKGRSRKTKFHDNEQAENTFIEGTEGDIETSTRPEVNTYLKEESQYNYALPQPILSYNPDQGLTLGAALKLYRYKFKRENIYTFQGLYSFGNESVDFSFTGDYRNLFDTYDFFIETNIQVPQYTHNFFGFGNETPFTQNLDFYRVNRQKVAFNAAIKKSLAGDSFMSLGVTNEAIQIEEHPNQLINSDAIPRRNFDWQTFTGLQYRFNFDYIDNATNPTNGITFKVDLGWKASHQSFSRNYARVASELGMYFGFGSPRDIVLATRFGVERNYGTYEFYQAVTLGGDSNLRGYNNERFSGRGTYYHNTDLRLRLARIRSRTLPFSLGVTGGFDYGRVWVTEDVSKRWHYAYGGSIWLAPLDAIVINTSLFFPREGDKRFSIDLNFLF